MKKIRRLTESQMNRIIAESVKQILKEYDFTVDPSAFYAGGLPGGMGNEKNKNITAGVPYYYYDDEYDYEDYPTASEAYYGDGKFKEWLEKRGIDGNKLRRISNQKFALYQQYLDELADELRKKQSK